MLKRGATTVQVIIGPEADIIADEIRTEIEQFAGARRNAGCSAACCGSGGCLPRGCAAGEQGPLDPDPLRWLAVFGGATNVASLDAIAATRLRVVVRDPSAVDRQRLSSLDVAWVSADTFHIVVGDGGGALCRQLATRLSRTAAARRRCRRDSGSFS